MKYTFDFVDFNGARYLVYIYLIGLHVHIYGVGIWGSGHMIRGAGVYIKEDRRI